MSLASAVVKAWVVTDPSMPPPPVAAIGGGVMQGYHLLHPNRREPSAGGGV
jgi:hypothetical protein